MPKFRPAPDSCHHPVQRVQVCGPLLRYALRLSECIEGIVQHEESADRDAAVAAAILHDVAIHKAERRHGSATGLFPAA